ncbi:MAG TPA: response regulator transcription factor, partial [Pyrinomonadaceae bacterium]|nr:response regulator transcription factor [Pyrinomonadaceae bacterium]
VRAGIRALLDGMKEIEVVGEAEGPRQTVELIRLTKPEILLLDVAATGTGLATVEDVAHRFSTVRIIVLAVEENEALAVKMLRAGAAGFISKTTASTELEMAIRTVARGEDYVAPNISRQALLAYLKKSDASEYEPQLTSRQSEVLQLIAEGLGTKEIARRLEISVKTVESHRTQIMNRLDMHDIPSLVRYAIRIGLINID